jgi:hypothetical protein
MLMLMASQAESSTERKLISVGKAKMMLGFLGWSWCPVFRQTVSREFPSNQLERNALIERSLNLL